MLSAFANIYADIADDIRRRRDGGSLPKAPDYPTGEDGLHTLAAIHAAAASARASGAWVRVADAETPAHSPQVS